MSEIRTPHLTNNAIPNAAQWNNAFRGMVREIQEMMLRLLHGDDTPSAGGGGVLGGLVCDNVSGQMQSSVTPGWGWYYDATLPSPQSPFGVVVLHETTIVNHTPADGSNPRIDVISIASPSDTDTVESTLTWEAAPENRPTQRGAQPALVVTAGTPAGSPVAPATPAGHLKLCEVTVPAGATNLNSAGYSNKRVMANGGKLRDADLGDFVFADRVGTGVVSLLTVLDLLETLEPSAIQWDRSKDYPVFYRGKGEVGIGGGDKLGAHYPMLIHGGRTWWRSVPWIGKEQDLGANPMTSLFNANYLTLARVNTTAMGYTMSVPIPADVRGIEVVAAKLRYQCVEAFDATWNEKLVDLIHVAADGTATVIGTATFTLSGVHGSVEPLTFTSLATPVIAEGDMVFASLRLASNGDGTAVGEVRLFSLDVQFREARLT